MYKALYGFDGQGQGTLRFQPKDEFNLIEQVDNHWWLMQSSSGETGLVPASYLEINKVCFQKNQNLDPFYFSSSSEIQYFHRSVRFGTKNCFVPTESKLN